MSAPTAPPPARVDRSAPAGRVDELKELSRTTPGVLIMFMAALVLVSILVGVFTAVNVQSRAQSLDDLSASSGPLSIAAQDIYRSLSDADATATSAFLAGGLEAADVRARYDADVAQAESALAVAVAAREPADLADPAGPLAILSGKLSVYTGLVETARANNHQGLPIGAAYQREASSLMRDELLPAAEQLYRDETARLVDDQDSAGSLPIFEMLLALLALVVLYFAQRFLRRRTRRRLNTGLAIATGAAVVSVLWVMIATASVAGNVESSRVDGSAQTDVLARARIATLAARADETLTLVARGSGAEFEAHYAKVRDQLTGNGGLIGQASDLATSDTVSARIDNAKTGLTSWHEVHVEIRKQDDAGAYADAVQLAIGPADDGAAAQFDEVDKNLREAIAATTTTFDDEVSQAANALTGTVIGVVLLALVMAAGSVAGIWQRLKEYR